jgi:hypothetical protein
MVSMNHARGWHALAASFSFHWRIRLEMIVGRLRSHLWSFALFQSTMQEDGMLWQHLPHIIGGFVWR